MSEDSPRITVRMESKEQEQWIKEARRRLKRYKNGAVEGISGEKVHRELTNKYLK